MAVKKITPPKASRVTGTPRKKTTSTKARSAKPVAKKAFPIRQLNAWLKNRLFWSENDWQSLLAILEEKGYGHLTSNQNGRDAIGLFLETHRKAV